jgi:hypothetical protein
METSVSPHQRRRQELAEAVQALRTEARGIRDAVQAYRQETLHSEASALRCPMGR